RIPIATAKTSPKEVSEACVLVSREGKMLIVKRGTGRLWEHFWEFPTIHVAGSDPAGRGLVEGETTDLDEGLRRLTGVRDSIGPVARTVRFGVTTHRVTLEAHEAEWLE